MMVTDHKVSGAEPQLYNSRIVNNYVRYLEKHYPEVDAADLFAFAGMEPWQVADQGHWFSQRQINLFHERIGQVTGSSNIPREVGRFLVSSEGMGGFRQYMISFLSLWQVYGKIGKVAGKLTRASDYAFRRLGHNRVEITVAPRPGVIEKPFQCQNRMGSLESPALFFTGEYPSVEHSECLFLGGPCCRYEISWKDGALLTSRRFRTFAYTTLAGWGGLVLWLVSGPALWLSIGLLPAVALLLHALGLSKERQQLRTHLEARHDANSRLLDQIDTTYKNAELSSELGRMVSFGANLDRAMENIMSVLAERLDFAHCMVYLADAEQEYLVFSSGYGWLPEELNGLRQTRFSLRKLNVEGALAESFRTQQAILVASKGQLEAFFSVLPPSVLRGLDIPSLIACPIVVNQAVIGMLVVDQLKTPRPLLQSDVSLLTGIAPVIGMNIHNLRLVVELEDQRQSLAAEVEHRTGELRASLGVAQELAQRAKDANLAKSQFLANMSHEIRTPLIGVLGMNELLLQTDLTEQQQDLAATVQASGETLLELLNDILDFSKIEAGKLTLEQVSFPLQETVEKAVAPLAETALGKGLDLVFQLAALSELTVAGDPQRLRQVLLNLVGNAIKFTSRGEVVVRAELLHLAAEAVTVRFSVRDTGIGIEPAAQQRIFEYFSQAENSTSRQYGGSGLGLAIVQQLVALQGGTLGLQSEPGAGSHFWFSLPLAVLASGQRVPKPLPQAAGGVLLSSSASLGEGLHGYFDLLGHSLVRVSAPSSVLDSLAAIKTKTGQLVLVDLALEREIGESALADFCAELEMAGVRMVVVGSRRQCSAMRSRRSNPLEQLYKPVLQKDVEALFRRPRVSVPAHAPQGLGTTDSCEITPGVSVKRILLVEDNPTTCHLVRAMLARHDCPLTVVDRGEKALALWSPGAFDLVLMDCQMPGIDGYETTARLRAAGCRAPIVALTARAQWDDAERCRQAGMDDYLGKPFKQKELLALIHRWLPDASPAPGEMGAGNELLL